MNINSYFDNSGLSSPVRKPEVVIPPSAVPPVKVDALALFQSDPAGLRASALDVLSIKVRPVETLDAANKLADQRAQVKTLLKNVEARRKLVVEPLNKNVSAVNAEAHRWTDPLIAWDKSAELVLLAFNRMEADRARREEEARQQAIRDAATRQAEAEAKGHAEETEAASREIMQYEATAPIQAATGYKTDAGTTSLRKTWKVEVVDESLVPDVYWMVDLKRLQAAVDAGARTIEGCNVFEQESLTVRTRG